MMRGSILVVGLCALAACGEVIPAQPDADPCASAVCECTVATQDTDCRAHAVCDETGPGRVCTCAPAYRDEGGACVFDGAPRDPGVTDPTIWVPVGPGARVDPAATGNLDPGEGVLDPAAMCAYSELVQKFVMPPLSKAEPFKVSVTYALRDPNGIFGSIVLDLGVGHRRFERVVPFSGYRTDTFCLGAADYGREIEFRIGTRGAPYTCAGELPAGEQGLFIDHLEVLPATADECPAPGTIPNADFEGTTNWAFSTLNGATAGIVDGIGETSSRAARLATVNRCSETSMSGLVALPAAGAIVNPALDVYYTGTGGGRLTVSFDGKNISTLETTNGTPRHAKICVPAWALGTVADLRFLLQRNAEAAGACSVALNRSFVIDNLRLVSDAGCDARDNMDPGFERIANANGPAPGWGLVHGHVNDVEGGTAYIVNNGFNAHTGSGVLRLGGSAVCVFAGEGGGDLTFTAPPSSGEGGPAVTFFARVGAPNPMTETVIDLGPQLRTALPENNTYTPHVQCIPPKLSGRRMTARFSTGGLGGGCSTFAEESAFIDDVNITTDATCPRE